MRPPRGPLRYACLWVPAFAAVALVRRDPRRRGQPLAAIAGPESARTVVAVTAEAWQAGIRPGMGLAEAVTRLPALVPEGRDPAAEASAAAALLDVALATSPRVEAAAPDRVHVDLAGLSGLFGDEERIGGRLATRAADLGLPGHVGIADSRTAAYLAARTGPGVTVVPPGRAPAFLARLPITLLDPSPELAETLERWGIRTLGALAALPPGGILARLGAEALALQARARGEDAEPFVPVVPPARCVEAQELDGEVTTWEGLGFLLRGLLERLAARLAVRAEGAAALALRAGLADGTVHPRRLSLVAPLRDPRTLASLLRADLEALRLPAPIVSLELEAETVPLRPTQADLFAPLRPTAQALGETLGRLAALVGADHVGAPVVEDTHRPTAVGLRAFPGTGARVPGPLPLRPSRDGGRDPAGRVPRARPEGPARDPRLPGGAGAARPGEGRTPGVPRVSGVAEGGAPQAQEARPPDPSGPAAGEPRRASTDRGAGPPPAPGVGGDDPALGDERPGTLACRRLVPPVPATVTLVGGRPCRIEAGRIRGEVLAWAGPWRTMGEWWTDTAWAREEWDIALPDGALYRLALDRVTGAWTLEGVYD